MLSPSNKAWDYKVKPFQLPPHTRIMLADVDAGSDTPSLVGKVLKWSTFGFSTGLKVYKNCTREEMLNREFCVRDWLKASVLSVPFSKSTLKTAQITAILNM